MMIVRSHKLLALVVSLSLFSVEAAAEAPSFNALVQEGMSYYRVRQYEQAIEKFEAAYALNAQPELIYNIARAYEKSLKRDEAVAAYDRFLRLEGTTADLRSKALNAQTALRREKAALQSAREVQMSPPRPPPGQGSPGSAATVTQPAKDPPSRTLEWVLVGGGAALAATGAVFGVLALQANSDFDDRKAAGADRAELQDQKTKADNHALAADVLIGAGVLSAAAGAILFLAGGDEEDVAVAPVFGPDYAAISLSGQF